MPTLADSPPESKAGVSNNEVFWIIRAIPAIQTPRLHSGVAGRPPGNHADSRISRAGTLRAQPGPFYLHTLMRNFQPETLIMRHSRHTPHGVHTGHQAFLKKLPAIDPFMVITQQDATKTRRPPSRLNHKIISLLISLVTSRTSIPRIHIHAASHDVSVNIGGILFHCHTLFLFTKSDFKTIIFPIVIFAACSAPQTSSRRVLNSLFWTWLHLLQFCVSNQRLSPNEDMRNKPWRPVPAARISVSQASCLRWILLPACVALSAAYDLTIVGIILSIGIFLHNECKLDSHWFTRNLLNALGYATFDLGATLIAEIDRSRPLGHSVLVSQILSTLVIFTTIHAQDFQDQEGDRMENRRTIPIVMPRAGRVSMPLTLAIWSFVVGIWWSASWVLSAAVMALGLYVGMRFYTLRNASADRTSYILYNLWLSLTRIMPVFVNGLADQTS